jgi:hypothetical protein
MRRLLLALTLSLAVHASVVAGAVVYGLWHTMSLIPSVKVEPVAIDLTKDLPLGAPAEKTAPTEGEPPVRVRKPKPKLAASPGQATIPSAPDAGALPDEVDAGITARPQAHDGGGSADGGHRRPGDLRGLGPDGSRLVALLRLDRLRASPDKDKTVAAVDQLLLLMPDRRRLIEGSGLDLFRDFDSLLVATPNPMDDAVTFLVVRHHLTESALKAGLERGAKAQQKPITWRTVDGRPVGIRQRVATSPAAPPIFDRDDRIIVLPQAAMAIMATPAYAAQLLGLDVLARPDPARAVDAGALDAGANRGAGSAKPHVNWPDIVARIDAEDSAMPDEAVFLITASNLFATGNAPGLVVPPTRGASEDSVTPTAPSDNNPLPESITFMAGLDSPFIELTADFKDTASADAWERDLPAWKHKVLFNPMVLLGGFSQLVGRTETTRDGDTIELRADTSSEELQRLLNLTANLARAALVRPR